MKNLNELTFKPGRPGAMKLFVEYIQEDMDRLNMTDRAIGLVLLPHYKKSTDGERVIFQCRKELIDNGYIEPRKYLAHKYCDKETYPLLEKNGIYIAIDTKTNKPLYIGCTTQTFFERWGQHISRSHNKKLNAAIAENRVKFSVLFYHTEGMTEEELKTLESYYIYTIKPEFNLQCKINATFDKEMLEELRVNKDINVDLHLGGNKRD